MKKKPSQKNTQAGKPNVVPVLVKQATEDLQDRPPVLKAIAVPVPRQFSDHELGALKAELVAVAWEVVLDSLHSAVREVEAALFEQVSTRLRDELPEIVERALRNHLRT